MLLFLASCRTCQAGHLWGPGLVVVRWRQALRRCHVTSVSRSRGSMMVAAGSRDTSRAHAARGSLCWASISRTYSAKKPSVC
jgi:hypothetical protein